MIVSFERLGFRYPGAQTAVLAGVDWGIREGELALVTGASGSGKSTLLRCLNGLVPHFTGGELRGRVLVAGLDTRTHGPRALSRTVGFVFQDPDAQHVAPTVEDELAFGMEQHGLPVAVMRERVEATLARLSLAHLRGRAIATLSGGERQRAAIGAAIALGPRILVLDEPLSQLDPRSADEVLEVIRRLHAVDGMTVVVAEHRVDGLTGLADQIREMGDAAATGSRERLPDLRVGRADRVDGARVVVERATLGIGGRAILSGVDLQARHGEVVALVGPNGSGKTTLLRSVLGALPPLSGRVVVEDGERGGAAGSVGVRVAYLPQRPGSVLFSQTVREEIAFTRRANPAAPDPAPLIDLLELRPLLDRDPRDLSAGERERAALAAVLAANPALVLLDEPTRGMDRRRKATLSALLRILAAGGATVVVATHDRELVAAAATRVLLLGDGRVVADGSPEAVLGMPKPAPDPVLDSPA